MAINLHPTEVHLWHLQAGDTAHQCLSREIESIVSLEELDFSRRFLTKKARETYLVARSFVRVVLSQYVDLSRILCVSAPMLTASQRYPHHLLHHNCNSTCQKLTDYSLASWLVTAMSAWMRSRSTAMSTFAKLQIATSHRSRLRHLQRFPITSSGFASLLFGPSRRPTLRHAVKGSPCRSIDLPSRSIGRTKSKSHLIRALSATLEIGIFVFCNRRIAI